MFSPYYAWARRREEKPDPDSYCALNVALYPPGRKRWALTERGRQAVTREARQWRIGPSSVAWVDGELVFRIDEVTAPWPSRLRGEVRLRPGAGLDAPIALDAEGRHHWWPIAPTSRVHVEFERPSLRWSGGGYLDWNGGDEPLEAAFASWHWSRAHRAGGSSLLFYDVARRDGSSLAVGLEVGADGAAQRIPGPPSRALPLTGWRVHRAARADEDAEVAVVKTLEDTPFYARSRLSTNWLGAPVDMMHESLSLSRFSARWVQTLLPFRYPRRG